MNKPTRFKQTEIGVIPEDWEVKKLSDCIELSYGKGLPQVERGTGKIPVFGSNGIIGYNNKSLIRGPGIVIGRKGSVGEVTFSKNDFWPIDTTYYVKVKKGNDIIFWYYFLKTLGINQMNSHSAVPGLSRDSVYEISKLIPPLPEQSAIAKILSDLDAKIELNQQMNKTLEEIGQALFKHWFIDFEFPNEEGKPYKSSGGGMVDSELGEIPKGWRVESLDNIADYLNGLDMQKYRPETDEFLPVIKIRELNQECTDDSSDKASVNIPEQYIIKNGDVIFSWSGTLMVKIWAGGIGGLNQHLFKVTSQKYDKWFYYLWTLNHLEKFKAIAKDKATTMGHIKRSHLTESKVLIPKDSDLKMMNDIMNPIFSQLIETKTQNTVLKEIRDTLLPKLMSGKIRVPLEVK